VKKIIVAIDGFSSCGKSTMARQLAEKLGYVFIDSGAMYRAVTLYFLNNAIDFDDKEAIAKALENITITFKFNPEIEKAETYLNGENVEQQIRTMEVSRNVSPVAAISDVRKFLVKQQQQMGTEKGIVMDGRDIGTVVFPNAELKIFLTANPEIRAQRRQKELEEKGQKLSIDEVRNNLQERDKIDSTREDSPLRQADDAKVLDNSDIDRDEQLAIVLKWANEKIHQASP
jgi:cytidylate kinase